MQSTYKQTTARVHTHAETAADYALADYQGDIKKVLLTEAKLLPGTDFLSEGEGQLSGGVVYDVVYADTEGAMCSVQLSSDYDMTVPAPDGAQDMMSELRVSGVSVRLSGPRKLSVKATVCADVRFVAETTVTTEGDAAGHDPALRESMHMVRYAVCGRVDDRVYTDAAVLEDADAEHTEILMTGGTVAVRDVTAEDDGVRFGVDVAMRALVRMADGSVRCIRRSVSADETVSVTGVRSPMRPVVRASVPTVAGVIQTDADGNTELQLTAHASFLACAEDNAPVSLIEDGYVCDFETDNSYGELCYEEFLDAQSVVLPFESALEEDSWDGDPLREVLYTSASLKSMRAELDAQGRVMLEGDVQASAIGVCCDEQGRRAYAPIRAAASFGTALTPHVSLPVGALAETDAQVLSADCILDEGRILLRGEVCVNVTMALPHTARYLSRMDVRHDTPIAREGSVITVYYPRRGESLWDIARTYRTTVHTLAQDNGLDVSTVSSDASIPLPERLLIF